MVIPKGNIFGLNHLSYFYLPTIDLMADYFWSLRIVHSLNFLNVALKPATEGTLPMLNAFRPISFPKDDF